MRMHESDIVPINQPVPLTVTVRDRTPIAVMVRGASHPIESIRDTWIIVDEWWRQEINRQYFAVVLDTGAHLTIYHDRMDDAWYRQEY